MKTNQVNPTKRLGLGLIRVSTAEQAKDGHGGIPAQREAVRRIAERQGIDVVKTFELTDISGARVRQSPEYQEFLGMCERPDITCVVTKEFSRLMRPERFDDWAILQHFADHGISLHFPDRVINVGESATARLMAGIEAGFAGFERQQIIQRINDAKEELRKKGYHPSAEHTLARGIGFNKERGWYYDETEIESVRLLFRLFLEGEQRYAKLSTLTGIPRSSVPVILTNPVYAGRMVYSKRHDLSPAGAYPSTGGKRAYRRKIQRPPEEVIEFPLPLDSIITQGQHELIKKLVESRRQQVREVTSENQPRFTYRGHLYCGDCGQNMHTHAGGKLLSGAPKDFYACRSRNPRERAARTKRGLTSNCSNGYVSRGKVEPLLDTALSDRLTDRDFLLQLIQSHLEKISSNGGGDDDGLVAKRIDTLQRKRERILEAFFDGNIRRDQKEAKIAAVDEEISTLSQVSLPLRRPAFDASQVAAVVHTFKEWPFLRMDQKRALLERLLPQIFVYRYEVRGVTLRVPFSDGYTANDPRNAG